MPLIRKRTKWIILCAWILCGGQTLTLSSGFPKTSEPDSPAAKFSVTVRLDPSTGTKTATVKLKKRGILVRKTEVTEGETFVFPLLPEGKYDLVIEAKHHSTYVSSEDILVETGSAVRREIQLVKAPFQVTGGAGTKTILCSACHKAIYMEMIRGIGTQFSTGPWPDADGNLIELPDHLDFYSDGSPEHLAFVSPMTVAAIQKMPKEKQKACQRCHAPDLIFQGGEIRSPPLRETNQIDGVSCVSCHLDEHGNIRGKYDLSAPHPTVQDPRFSGEKSHELCAACHQSDAMAPNQQTVAEWQRDFFPTDSRTCQDCHMPPVVRKLSEIFSDRPDRKIGKHLFNGGHSLPTLQQAATITVEPIHGEKPRIGIFVTNSGAGHSLPTGHGPRAVVVKMILKDPSGKTFPLKNFHDGIVNIYTVNPSMGKKDARIRPAIRAGKTEKSLLELGNLPPGEYTVHAQLLYDLDRLEPWNDRDLPLMAETYHQLSVGIVPK